MSLLTNIRSALGLPVSTHARAAKAVDRLDEKALVQEEAYPSESLTPMASVTGVRKAVNDMTGSGITPTGLANIISSAASLSDTSAYLKLAETVEEKDAHYRSVLSTRKLSVVGLDIAVEAVSDSARDVEIAETVRGVLHSEMVQDVLIDLMDGLSKGFSVCETTWDRTAPIWLPASIVHRPQHWFEFDKTDGKTLYLKPATMGGALKPLTPGKYLVHTPKLKTGLPIRGGLALTASWAWLIKSIALKDWAAFVEIFGQPIRYGTYAPGSDRKDIAVLKQAVYSLGVDAAAVFPESMKISFVESGGKSGSADLYHSLCEYMDSQVSKLVLGQTLTTDNGGGSGSFALGKVHGDVRADILRSDAKALASTLVRDLVKPLVELNYGSAAIPEVHFVIEEAEDLRAWTENIATMVGVGLEVEQSVVQDKLGIPAPAEGAKLLGMPAQPQDPMAVQSRGCPVHGGVSAHSTADGGRDAMDDLADELYGDFERLADPIKQGLMAAVEGATTVEEMKTALQNVLMTVDTTALVEAIAIARTKTRLAGETGADL